MIAWEWPLYAGEIPYPTWAYTLVGIIPLIVMAPLVIMFIHYIVVKGRAGVSFPTVYLDGLYQIDGYATKGYCRTVSKKSRPQR